MSAHTASSCDIKASTNINLSLPTTPSSTHTQLESAAQRVYNTPELRQQILSHTRRNDLATFMRVEKGCMSDVSRVLYRTVEYAFLEEKLRGSHLHQQIYRAAITELLVFQRDWEKLPMLAKCQASRSSMPVRGAKYHPDIIEVMIPPIQAECLNLQSIRFLPDHYGLDDKWSVNLQRRSANGNLGHVELYRYIRYYIDTEPPTFIAEPASPPPGYTIQQSFDLHLQIIHERSRQSPQLEEAWLKKVREDTSLGGLGGVIDVGSLPVTFNDLAHMYRIQEGAEGGSRLYSILGKEIAVHDMNAFQQFAQIATTSLRELHLSSSDATSSSRRPENNKVSITDLSVFIEIIRSNLPNLYSLKMAMQVPADSESVCEDVLTACPAEIGFRGGKGRQLEVYSDNLPLAPFNLIRVFSRICASGATIRICDSDDKVWDNRPNIARFYPGDLSRDPIARCQSAYLLYLQQQTPDRQRYLANLDFASVGVMRLCDVDALQYHADGRPKRRSEIVAAKSAREIERATEEFDRIAPSLKSNLDACSAAVRKLSNTTSDANSSEVLDKAERLLASLTAFQALARHVAGLTEGEGMEDLRRFVRSLQARERFKVQ